MSAEIIDDILHFWFAELSPKNWFRRDADVDATIKRRYEARLKEIFE